MLRILLGPVAFELHRSEKSRHFVLRLGNGESLADALTQALRAEQVMCGWLRASGVLADVELRAFQADGGSLGPVRRIAGPLQVLTLEGGAGLGDQGEPTVSLRALLARETDRGLETLAGELTGARVIGLEALITVMDDLALERSVDRTTGVALFSLTGAVQPSGEKAAVRPAAPARPAASAAAAATTAASSAWSSAIDASSANAPAESPARPRFAPAAPSAPASTVGAQSSSNAAMPLRPVARPGAAYLETPVPQVGDIVEHFAFGSCEVVKSDGDRLHLRVGKEGRIREIALEMLRVTRLDDVAGKPHYKLERRM